MSEAIIKDIGSFFHLLEITQSEIESDWSQEDRALCDWLKNADIGEYVSLLEILKPRMNNEVCTDKYFKRIEKRYPGALSELDRNIGSILIVHEIRNYSGRTFFSKPPYENTLTKVHKRIAKHFKKAAPEIASVAHREELITEIMVGEAIRSLSPDQLESAMKGAEFDPSLTKEKQKQILLQTIGAGGMAALIQLLGKNVIKKVIIALIEEYIEKKLGQKAASEVLTRVASKVPAYVFEGMMFWIGIGFIVKDVWDISGEATRITTPMITTISIGRTLQRIAH